MSQLQSCTRWLTSLAIVWLSVSHAATAQMLRAEPIVVGDDRVTVAGDVSWSFSCAHAPAIDGCGEDSGFFNHGNYDISLVRNFRVNISAAVKATRRVSVLTEIRSDNFLQPTPYALYVRVRPWLNRRFDVQAGRIPPSFGAFSRRPYPADNLLVGLPLAYHYLTSLRPDALPASADELIRMRGRGWLSSFTVGNATAAAGVPLVNGLTWDTGIQAHMASDSVDAAVSFTTGTLAHPVVRETNAGRQVAGRVGVQPIPGFIAGISAARGPFAARSAALAAGLAADDQSITQSAWGADLEYSRGYYLLRAEAILSQWELPAIGAPVVDRPLRALATSVEGRYKLRPGLYAAARLDRLTFNDIVGSRGPRSWEAPVTRLETGIGYLLQRNLLLKLVYQHNDRDGGRVPVVSIGAGQLVYWF